MELTVTRLDASTYRLSDYLGGVTITSAEQRMSLMDEDVIQIKIEAPTKCNFQIGDTITYIGRKYKINQLPKYERNGLSHIYDIKFEGVHYDLLAATFNLNIDTTSNDLQDLNGDSLTGKIADFLDVIVANANRVFPGKWEAGYAAESEDKTLTFSEEDNCLSVLNMICDTFETEFWVEQILGVNILHLHEMSYNVSGTFEHGHLKGYYQISRDNVNADNLCTRLFAYGTTENVPNRYRADRLCMPGKNKNDSYIENQNKIDTYGLYEKRKYFDINPSRTGTITSLGSDVLSFVDSAMFDLNAKWTEGTDYNEYLLITNQVNSIEVVYFYINHVVGTYKYRNSESPVIKFTSGNLSGYEVQVHSYDHATKTFKIVATKEQDIDIPSEEYTAFRFAAGDTYKLSSINLPLADLEEAEAELALQAQSYYNDFSVPFVQYKINLDELSTLFKNSSAETSNVFIPGYKVHIKDSDYSVDRYIKIKDVKRDLLYPLTYEITTADVSYRDKKYRIARTIERQPQLNGVFGDQLTKTTQLTKSIPRRLPRIDKEDLLIAENPVLREGEMCIVGTEFGQVFKIGNGSPFVDTFYKTNNAVQVLAAGGTQFEIYNPINQTTHVIYHADPIEEDIVIKLDSFISSTRPYKQLDARLHKIIFVNNNTKPIYLETQLSDPEVDNNSVLRDIGTVTLAQGAYAVIEFMWYSDTSGEEPINVCVAKCTLL